MARATRFPTISTTIPDAQPRLEPLHRFANRPYVVLGKAYEPHASLRPHQERGIASWYGKKFHGQKTSIGEPYDMFAMTAAHPTLAIPSYVAGDQCQQRKVGGRERDRPRSVPR
jgi:rare lipoprotein A